MKSKLARHGLPVAAAIGALGLVAWSGLSADDGPTAAGGAAPQDSLAARPSLEAVKLITGELTDPVAPQQAGPATEGYDVVHPLPGSAGVVEWPDPTASDAAEADALPLPPIAAPSDSGRAHDGRPGRRSAGALPSVGGLRPLRRRPLRAAREGRPRRHADRDRRVDGSSRHPQAPRRVRRRRLRVHPEGRTRPRPDLRQRPILARPRESR